MRKVREVLRLHYAAGMSLRAVARSLKVSPAVPAKAGMGKCIRRAEAQGLSWPLPDSLDDAGLERRLFPALAPRGKPRPVPRWSEVHRELRGKGVTLALLWEEYKAVHPEGLQYSRFCEQYRAWASKLDVAMRQEHRAGEKAVRGLRRAHGGGGGPSHRGGASSTGLRRGAGSVELHLCRGDVDTGLGGLGRFARARVRVLRELSRAGRPRQPARGGEPGASRTSPTPIRPTTTWPATTGSRCCRRGCDARATRPTSKPAPEWGNRGWACRWSSAGYWPRSAIARASRWPSSTRPSPSSSNGSTHVHCASSRGRGARCSTSSTAPRFARCPPSATCSPSGRRSGSTSTPTSRSPGTTTPSPHPGPAPARRAPHRHHRGVPVPRSLPAQGPPHHRRRAHAREAPPDGAVDARALHPLGREDRPAHHHPHHHRARLPAPPPAGVALLPGDCAPGQQLRRGPPRSGRAPRAGHRQPQLPQRRVHPPIQTLGGRPRPSPRRDCLRAGRTRRPARAPQHPRRRLLRLGGHRQVDPSHRGQAPPAPMRRHGQGAHRTARLTRGPDPRVRGLPPSPIGGAPRTACRPRAHRTTLPTALPPAARAKLRACPRVPGAGARSVHRGHRLPPAPGTRQGPRPVAGRRALGA